MAAPPRWAGVALGAFALLFLAGTALHPLLPASPVAAARLVAGNPRWAPAHLVTLLGAFCGAAGFARVAASRRTGWAGLGLVLAWAGFAAIGAALAVELTQVVAAAPGAAAGQPAAVQVFGAAHEATFVAFTVGFAFAAVGSACLADARWVQGLLVLAAAVGLGALALQDPARSVVGAGALLVLVAWAGLTGLARLAGPARGRRPAGPPARANP
jgi:hypothetical protein